MNNLIISRMMNLLCVPIFLSSTYTFASCRNDQIEYSHSSSIGLSIGGGKSVFSSSENNNLKIPFSYQKDGKLFQSCFEQENEFSVHVSSDADKYSGEIILSTPAIVSDEVNIETNNYILYHFKNEVQLGQTADDLKVEFLSVACAGENVLSYNHIQGNFSELKAKQTRQLNEVSTSFSTYIAIGIPAESLKERDDNSSNGFEKYLEETSGLIKNLSSTQSSNFNLPSVLVNSRIEMAGVKQSNKMQIGKNKLSCLNSVKRQLEIFKIPVGEIYFSQIKGLSANWDDEHNYKLHWGP